MIKGDINVQNSMWDKHCKNSCKLVLEDTILRHAFMLTPARHTYHQSPCCQEPFT